MAKNVVCIVSAICTNTKPFDYTSTRSAFSHEQRFQQSLETIQKLRISVPNAYIVFIEGTVIGNEMQSTISSIVDEFFDATQYAWVTNEVEGLYKGRGEIASLLAYLTSPSFQHIKGSFDSLSKISGRYKPEDGFMFGVEHGHIVAKLEHNKHHHSNEYMSTMFYTVCRTVLDEFISASCACFEDEELRRGVALEHILPMYIKKQGIPIFVKTHLYVGGEYGPWGGYTQH